MNNTLIYLIDLAIILGVGGLLLWLVRRRQRGRLVVVSGTPVSPPSVPLWRRALNLAGFGLLAFSLIALALMVVRNYEQLLLETRPAPSQVEIPADLPFEVQEVTFLSKDGLRMSGWYVPPQNGTTIILLHGYGANRLQMRWHAETLVEYGYGVLMYDERASGESQGDYRSYGWEDPADVGGALDFLREQQPTGPLGPVGIAGCSIGGQIALQGAANYPEIGAVWADGPATVRASDIKFPVNPIGKLVALSNFILDWMYTGYLGIAAPTPMLDLLPEISPRPIMLVGGGSSRPITGSEARQIEHYANHAGLNAQVWIIPAATHCDGPSQVPAEYAERLVNFFSQALEVPTIK